MTKACCVLLALLGLGCAPDVVPVEMVFTKQDPFLWSTFFRVAVFPVERSGAEECPERTAQAAGNVFDGAIFDTGNRTMCDMVTEEVLLPDFPEGEYAFVGLTLDTDNGPLTTGCRAGELVGAEDGVRIMLFPTSLYQGRYGMDPPPCLTVQDLCSGECDE